MRARRPLLGGAVLVYFLVALEVPVLISPFAGLARAVFDPVLACASAHPATRWLSAFFLPHLVVPGDSLLIAIRILGSALTVLGTALFLACAAQLCAARLGRRGPATGGLYAWIRHPQYAALAMAGLGLAILWPRFLNAVLWLAMAPVCQALARDEERRLLAAHPEVYGAYRAATGRFLPAALERLLTPATRRGRALLAASGAALALAAPFALRAYSVRRLTLWTWGPEGVVVAILPEDAPVLDHRMGPALGLAPIWRRLRPGRRYLGYLVPPANGMRGLVTDAGGWRLSGRQGSLALVADWVFNPFGRLRGQAHAMHLGPPLGQVPGAGAGLGAAMTRRLIVLAVDGVPDPTPAGLFAVGAVRTPLFLADVDMHHLQVLGLWDLPPGSGWAGGAPPCF